MRLPPTYRTKRLVLAISQVVVKNCREFEVVITDQQLVINEKQTWCHPAEHICRFEPRAAIDDDILRCSIRDNMRLLQFVAKLVSLSVWCSVLCRRYPPSGPWDQAVFFLGPPGLGFLGGGLLASWRCWVP